MGYCRDADGRNAESRWLLRGAVFVSTVVLNTAFPIFSEKYHWVNRPLLSHFSGKEMMSRIQDTEERKRKG